MYKIFPSIFRRFFQSTIGAERKIIFTISNLLKAERDE